MTIDQLIAQLQSIRTELGRGDAPVTVTSLKHRYPDCAPTNHVGLSIPRETVFVEIVID